MESSPAPAPAQAPERELEPEQKKLKSSPENQAVAGEEDGAGEPTLEKKKKYKRRKIAIFFAYCGAGYQGMQKNPGAKTIEADLEKALFLAGALREEDLGEHRRVDWARSSRTDKGVSAVGQVISGRFVVDPPGLVHRLNSNLSSQIRVFGFTPTTSSFSAKNLCDRRRYAYLLPVFALDPASHRDRDAVLATLGSDFQLSLCFHCSQRGRKLRKSEHLSSVSSDSPSRSSKNGGFLLDSSISSFINNSSTASVNKIDDIVSMFDDRGNSSSFGANSRVSESKQMKKIENTDSASVDDGLFLDSSISSFTNNSSTASVNKIDDIFSLIDDRGNSCASNQKIANSRVSESKQMKKIENTDSASVDDGLLFDSSISSFINNSSTASVNKIDDIVSLFDDRGNSCASNQKIANSRVSESKQMEKIEKSRVSCLSHIGIGESRVSEMQELENTQNDGDSSPSDAQIISSNGCDSISKFKVSISKEMNKIHHTQRRAIEGETEAFSLRNCGSMDAGEGRVELENTEKRRAFRYGGREMGKFNRILQNYVGTHNFHNFTTRTGADDPSARRFIVSFSADSVVEIDGIEFVKCEVVGQSFMLHQIRKMIGLAVAVMRGCASESFIQTALKKEVKVNVPTAPEVGLHLEECMFTHYNARWKETHEEVTLREYMCEAESFKTNTVYPHIASAERREGVVALWLHSLNHRNYPDLCPHPTTP